MFQSIHTKNFLLRELRESDAGKIFLLRSDPEVNKYLDRQHALTIEDAKEFISRILRGMAENNLVYWVIERENFAGTIGYWNFENEGSKAEIGFELLPAEQGKGILKEVLPAVIDYGFTLLGLHIIEAVIDINNIASKKLLEKSKFQPAGKISEKIVKYELRLSGNLDL